MSGDNTFMGDFECERDMLVEFSSAYEGIDTDMLDALDGATIIIAAYDNEACAGEAFVLFERDGKLYEVNASHCSCYGLENQWDPEETTLEALKMRAPWDEYCREAMRIAIEKLEGK